jgi:hypothetical protein
MHTIRQLQVLFLLGLALVVLSTEDRRLACLWILHYLIDAL